MKNYKHCHLFYNINSFLKAKTQQEQSVETKSYLNEK